MSAKKFEKLFKEAEAEVAKNLPSADNSEKRRLYSVLQILRIDIEEAATEKEPYSELLAEIDTLSKTLNLTSLTPSSNPIVQLETALRFTGCCTTFILLGTFGSLPLLALNALDEMMGADPFTRVSQKLKRAMTSTFIYQSGIELEVLGAEPANFQSQCTLATFAHASNLDGFIMSSTCPIKQLAFGKKELFMCPFFSWLSLAVGGVPVDRNNRDRAVGALKRTAEAAKSSKMCIAVAPEGTRSTTGQLNAFKKGTFYMWEELNAPIVPVVMFGAFDIYPRKAWVNQTGHVTVRYLSPIFPNEAKDRDSMLRLVRRRMLEAMKECPHNVGKAAPMRRRIVSTIFNIAIIALLVKLCMIFREIFHVQRGIAWSKILGVGFAGTMAITVFLYVYYVYIIHLGQGKVTNGSSSSSKSRASKKEE